MFIYVHCKISSSKVLLEFLLNSVSSNVLENVCMDVRVGVVVGMDVEEKKRRGGWECEMHSFQWFNH